MTVRKILFTIAAALVLIASGVGTASATQLPGARPALAFDFAAQDCSNFTDTDVNRLSEQKWRHLEVPKHKWQEYGYVTRPQIAAALRNAFVTGRTSAYGGAGSAVSACQAQVIENSPNGRHAFVTVTYQIVGGTARVGSAWVTALNCAYPCSGGP